MRNETVCRGCVNVMHFGFNALILLAIAWNETQP
jgi:hypothetical protein